MRRVHFGFRAEGGAFAGGHATYSARAEAGAVRVTPHYPEDGPTPGAPSLTLATRSITRGGVPAPLGTGRASLRDDGSLAIDRGAAVEHLENTDDGVEQSFAFDERPSGRGDVEVRIAVSGLAFSGASAGGLHFQDDPAELGVRYGNAFWIDAHAQRAPLPVRYDGGDIVITVAARLLDESAYPARIDPTIGPEISMNDPLQTVAWLDQRSPAIAFGATDYLVTWVDDRRNANGGDIWAARVSSQGAVLDTSGIPVFLAPSAGQFPAVSPPAITWGGNAWMITWISYRPDSTGDLYAARVSPAGALLDPSALVIDAAGPHAAPSVAWDGANYLFVSVDTTSIRGVRVSPGGGPVGVPFTISTPSGTPLLTAVSFNGTNHLAAYTYLKGGSYCLGAVRVSPAGVVLDAAEIPITSTTGGGNPFGLATNGTNWYVAWSRSNTSMVYGAQITASGGSIGSGDLLANVAAVNGKLPSQVSVVYGGNGYSVIWAENDDIYAMRLSAGGLILTAPNRPLQGEPGTRSQPVLAHDGTGQMLAFHGDRLNNAYNNNGDIFAAHLSYGLQHLDAQSALVSQGATAQSRPSVAYNGTNYLVAWSENLQNGTGYAIYGTRVSDTGMVLDPAGIAIAAAQSDTPQIASNGTDWIVVWINAASQIKAQRVAAAGTLLGGVITLSPPNGPHSHSVGANGTSYIVAWSTFSSGYNAARILANGTVADPNGFNVGANVTPGTSAPIPWNGTHWLLTWEFNGDVFAARVAPNGAVLDAGALAIPVAANVGVQESSPRAASDGSGWLVMWSADAQSMRGARISANGTLLDPVGISIAPGPTYKQLPSVSWDGSEYFASWTDLGAATSGTYGARVSGGVVLDPGGVPLITPFTANFPRMAAGKPGQLLLVYTELKTAQPYGAERVFGRLITPAGAAGSGCTQATDCASGFCADGKCCDTACNGTCEACSAAKKGQGADGACGPVVKDTDPDDECAVQAPSTCKLNGLCDGNGACARYAADTECAPPSCAGGVASKASVCDGAGTCVAGATSSCVEGYACKGTACATSCADDTACAPGYVCDTALKGCVQGPDGGTGGSGGSGGGTTTSATGGSGGTATETTTTTSSTGEGGTGSGGSEVPAPPPTGGCGCRVADARRDTGAGLGIMLGLLAWARRRSRVRPASRPEQR